MNSFFAHEFYLFPLAAHCAADRLEHFHDVRVFAKRIIFAGAGVTRLISS
jgi:hypothetical protein